MNRAISAFLLGFPALFSIVNPISGAFIFCEFTATRPQQRMRMARPAAPYALVVMTIALWAGSCVLGFFGITLDALLIAGGTVVTLTGRNVLQAPDETGDHKPAQAADGGSGE